MYSPSVDLDLAAEHKADLRGKRMGEIPLPFVKARGDDSHQFGIPLLETVYARRRLKAIHAAVVCSMKTEWMRYPHVKEASKSCADRDPPI